MYHTHKKLKLQELQDQAMLAGYIDGVGEEFTSNNNRQYFDVDIKISSVQKRKVRVMSDKTYSHEYFESLCEQKEAVLLSNVSPIKSGRSFFNPSIKGTELSPLPKHNLNFDSDELNVITVTDINAIQPTGTFKIQGQIQWVESSRQVNVSGNKRTIREAKFLDKTGCMDLSVWGTELISSLKHETTYIFTNIATNFFKHMRLTTTFTTTYSQIESDEEYSWQGVTMKDHIVLSCP
eukprot:TCONS_00037282-protein